MDQENAEPTLDPASLEQVLCALRDERKYQVTIKGYTSEKDKSNSIEDWAYYIRNYLNTAETADTNTAEERALVKVAALAVAALQARHYNK